MTEKKMSCPSCGGEVSLEEQASLHAGNMVYRCRSCGTSHSLLQGPGRETARLKSARRKRPGQARLVPLVTPSSKAPLPAGISLVLDLVEGEGRGRSFKVEWTRSFLGREGAEIPLDDPGVSRKHALLTVFDAETILLKDMASTNGTYHNGQLIDHCKIEDGDRIRIGSSVLNVCMDREPAR